MKLDKTNQPYIAEIKDIISAAKQQVYSSVNSTMVKAYWLIGKRIVEEEQNGKERAEYGKQIIKTLSKELNNEFGRGFSTTNIKYFRQFHLTFPLPSDILSIGHLPSDLLKTPISHLVSDQFDSNEEIEILTFIFTRLSWTHVRQILRVKNTKSRNYYIKETANNSWTVETLNRNIATQYYERLLLSDNKEPVIKNR